MNETILRMSFECKEEHENKINDDGKRMFNILRNSK